MKENKLSIIIPVYNDEASIEQTLDSVVSQKYDHWECIIIDDCSTDNSARIVQDYILESEYSSFFKQIKMSKNSDQLNAIIAAKDFIQGDYVYILHSDDYLYDDSTFERMNKECLKFSEADAIIAPLALVDVEGKSIGFQKVKTYSQNKTTFVNQILLYGMNQFIDVAIFKAEIFKNNVYKSYLTNNIPFWIKWDDTGLALDVKNTTELFTCYRIHGNNYINNEIGLNSVLSGELRTFVKIYGSYNIPGFSMQRFFLRFFNKLKLNYNPLFFQKRKQIKPSGELINRIIENRLATQPKNEYFRSIVDFYKQNNDRTVFYSSVQTDVFQGKDCREFFKQLKEGNLNSFYYSFMKDMQLGFSKIECEDELSRDKILKVLTFFSIWKCVEVTVKGEI